jgi:hypothetical protein
MREKHSSSPSGPNVPVQSAAPATVPLTEAKLHYDELRQFFHTLLGWVLGAIGLLATVGGLFFYSSVKEMKEQARADIAQAKSAAEKEIETIRTEASRRALEEARKRVEDEFKQNNIAALIQNAAQKEVSGAMQKIVAAEVDRSSRQFSDDMQEIGRAIDAGILMRVGHRQGLDRLTNFGTPYQPARFFAQNLRADIARDYDEIYKKAFHVEGPALDFARKYLEIAPTASEQEVHAELLKRMEKEESLDNLARDFIVARAVTRGAFQMFEIDSFKTWLRKNPGK